MHTTLVKPPATAARQPLSIVSRLSCPGSRRCVCKSTNPGATIQPCASIVSSGRSDAGGSPKPAPTMLRSFT